MFFLAYNKHLHIHVLFFLFSGIIQSAKDLYNFATAELTKELTCSPKGHHPRTFMWIDKFQRPELQSKLCTLKGTMKLHDVRSNGDNCSVNYKHRSCFCKSCIEGEPCSLTEYTGDQKNFILIKENEKLGTKKGLLATVNSSNKELHTPVKSSNKEHATPGKSSNKERVLPGKSSDKESASPGQSSNKGRAMPVKSSKKERTTPGKLSDKERATPGKTSNKKRTTPAKSSNKKRASPAKSSDKERATPGKSNNRGRATPGKSSNKESATPGKSSNKKHEMQSKTSSTEFTESVQQLRKSQRKNLQHNFKQAKDYLKGSKKPTSYTFSGPVTLKTYTELTSQLIHSPYALQRSICQGVVMENVKVRNDLSIVGMKAAIDASANTLYATRSNIPGIVKYPMLIEGDGNCLPRCGSVLAYGTQEYHRDIRLRIAVELIKYPHLYLDADYLSRGWDPANSNKPTPVIFAMFSDRYTGQQLTEEAIRDLYYKEVDDILSAGAYMGAWQIFALASVLRCPLYCIYPLKGCPAVQNDLHRLILPRETSTETPCFILWSSTRSDMPPQHWRPNHFAVFLPMTVENETAVATENGCGTAIPYTERYVTLLFCMLILIIHASWVNSLLQSEKFIHFTGKP